MKRFAILLALVCMNAVTSGGRGRRGCRSRGPTGERSNPPFVDKSIYVAQPTPRMERAWSRYWERRMQRLLDSITE